MITVIPEQLWCVLWNPSQRYLHRERLDRYLAANRQALLDARDARRVEIVLEISADPAEIDAKLAEWSAIQLDPPPLA